MSVSYQGVSLSDGLVHATKGGGGCHPPRRVLEQLTGLKTRNGCFTLSPSSCVFCPFHVHVYVPVWLCMFVHGPVKVCMLQGEQSPCDMVSKNPIGGSGKQLQNP